MALYKSFVSISQMRKLKPGEFQKTNLTRLFWGLATKTVEYPAPAWLWIGAHWMKTIFLCSVAKSFLTLCDPMDCRSPGSSVHGTLLGKNTGVGCHFLLQEIFPNPGIKPVSPALAGRFFATEPLGSPVKTIGLIEKRHTWTINHLFKIFYVTLSLSWVTFLTFWVTFFYQ